MGNIDTAQQKKAYIEKKYCGPWKATLAKIKALEAELPNLRSKCKMSLPQGLPADSAKKFQEHLDVIINQQFRDIDRWMADVKHLSEHINRHIDALGRYGN